MPKHGKNYMSKVAGIDRNAAYSPREAIEMVKNISFAKFDETVEVHMRLNVDPRHADQQVRGTVSLPAGTGKTVRILVFAEGEWIRVAEEAGADYAGTDEYIQRIMDGWLEFDVAVAIPQVMGKIGRLGRVLGPRGLMPNPRAGTVVQPDEIADTIEQLRQGRVEFRVDRTSNLHVPIGKVSFEVDQLMSNLAAVMDAVMRARPAAVRGAYIRRLTLASTMGPGLRVDIGEAQNLRV
ncbi:MAG TPA: 50S ribosomal protein L1 [Chloroflexi bacterium]|jgi:large subunit ribosomal protein L1|nr:50S ribosomal protein L1 [Chloroflexota bacterium]